ncbi:hypothetical protein HYW94_02030 [Candidatus Uhrbacteria bacterium]|nr:hypothetical protein [Candidatus Uhrbacteria bacterium]
MYLLSLTVCVTGCRFPFFSKPTSSNTTSQTTVSSLIVPSSPSTAGELSIETSSVPVVTDSASSTWARHATLTIRWPARAIQVIPSDTESILFQAAKLDGTLITSASISRPTDAATSSITLPKDAGSYLPVGPIILSVYAKNATDGIVAQASKSVEVMENYAISATIQLIAIGTSTPTPMPPSPPPAEVVVPISFPMLAIFIDSKDQGKARVMESLDSSKGLLENAQALELSPLTSESQESVVVHVALPISQTSENALVVYKKSPLVADWLKTDIQVSADAQSGYVQAPIPLPSDGSSEYLIAGREKPIPSDVTFENISPVVAPQDPLFTDSQQAQSRSRSITSRLRVQSTVHPVIPDKDVIKDPSNKKILVVFVHGAGSEAKSGYRWNPLKNFLLTASAQSQEIRDSFEFWSFQYDSTKEIAGNALLLRDAIHTKFGAQPYIVVAHSMGGLLAEFLYADEMERKTFLGMVTLGTPYHGSPFAIPKMFREMASHQALPTLKYTLYWGVSNNFVSTIPSPTGENRVVDPFVDFSPVVFTIGHRCLAFDGFGGEIPTRTYTLPFIVGEEKKELTETLSSQDRLCVPCQYSKLYTYPGLENIPHTSGFPCYFNFTEALQKLKEYKGSAVKPHAFRYAGYFQELVPVRYEKILLFDMAVKSLNDTLHKRNEPFEQQALRYAAMDMLSLPSVTGGLQSPFVPTDGLVPVESALAQAGRAYIVDPRSTEARLILDESAIERQKPTDTIAYRMFPDYSHLDMVIGKFGDTRLFDSVANDILWLKNEYNTTVSYSFAWSETNMLTEKTEEIVLLGENIDEQLIDGIRIRRAAVISSQAVPSSTEQNRATVTLVVEKSSTVVYNNGSSYFEGTWRETRIASFGRINGAWYWITLQ